MRKEHTLITNIQRMCMNDGPGIRTTVFVKGCNLHCPWCANPENISFAAQEYQKDGRKGSYGTCYTAEELLDELMKDYKFWFHGGGVTFSGGEPLIHMDFLETLMEELKNQGVHITIETALFADEPQVQRALAYTDLFIVDMKILQPEICRNVLGGDVLRYLNNLEMLAREHKSILLRIPCNHEYTLTEENMSLIKAWCRNHPRIPVEIFATHSLGKAKYDSLGLECREWETVSDQELEAFAASLRSCGNAVEINRL